MGSANHAIFDSEDQLPSNLTDRFVEHQLSIHSAVGRLLVTDENDCNPPDARKNNVFDHLDAVLDVQTDFPEVRTRSTAFKYRKSFRRMGFETLLDG